MKSFPCSDCGVVLVRNTTRANPVGFCIDCRKARRVARMTVYNLACVVCQKPVVFLGKEGGWRAKTGKIYCSEEHQRIRVKEIQAKVGIYVTTRDKELIRERMVKFPPMRDPKTREKVSATRIRLGQYFQHRGGNGKPPPEQQKKLAEFLSWPMEVVILTGWRTKGKPRFYFLDIANVDLRIAIEVDGLSHSSPDRMASDDRKTQFLESLGWVVFRFTNREVQSNLKSCAAKVLEVARGRLV